MANDLSNLYPAHTNTCGCGVYEYELPMKLDDLPMICNLQLFWNHVLMRGSKTRKMDFE
jgi:hypothetical protein